MRRDAELERFVQVAGGLAVDHAGSDDDRLRRALDDAGLLTLAVDAADLDHAMLWLTSVIEAVAEHNPSLAFVLASHYAADLAAGRDGLDATSGGWRTCGTVGARAVGTGRDSGQKVLMPGRFDPEHVLVVDLPAVTIAWSATDSLVAGAEQARTGLAAARLHSLVVEVPGPPAHPAAVACCIRDWSLLLSAVALGIATAAAGASGTYARERVQFGAAIASFSGLRTILSEMQLKVLSVGAMVDAAVVDERDAATALEVWAAAGRVAVEVCVDAIQVYGGYGYIEEYPVAGLLRDAISLQARGGGRRVATATAAALRASTPTEVGRP